jgi:hypothetical protein
MWWFVELSAKYRNILFHGGIYLRPVGLLKLFDRYVESLRLEKNIYKATSACANNGIKTTGS